MHGDLGRYILGYKTWRASLSYGVVEFGYNPNLPIIEISKIYSNVHPQSVGAALQTVRLDKKTKIGTNGLTSPRGHNVGAVRMLWLEKKKLAKPMRMIALCADVEEAESRACSHGR